MKTVIKFASSVVIALMGAVALQAQEWSAAQKEVWSNVEAYSQASAKDDLEGFMAYIDDDYLGWARDAALPGTKADVREALVYAFESRDVIRWDIKPVGIKIHGDIAFVHYYYSTVTRGKDGKDTTRKGRWTDILKKKGQRWVQIGDHGGADPAN